MKPSVSIVIPTINRPKLLQRAVRSALIGCPEDGEVIVVDARSDTAEQALAALATDKRLKVITNAGDKGAAGARNTGVSAARSDIFLFLDDDDALMANYPNRVLTAASDPAVVFGFSTMTVHRGDTVEDTRRGKLKPGLLAHDVPLENKTAGLGAGFWIDRAVFLAVGGIKTDQINDEDTDLCCRLYGHGHNAWFEAEPGCIIYQDYETGDDTAPQLPRSTEPGVMAACYMRTFQHLNDT